MSGRHFNYNEHRIHDIVTELENFISEDNHEYSSETMTEFKTGLRYLKLAYTYAHRIDMLVSSDDSEASFHKRLKEDLTCIGCCSENSESKCSSCGTMNLVQITEESK